VEDDVSECVVCGKTIAEERPACRECSLEYPDALIKACFDPFTYVLQIRSGQIIAFESASINGDWVHLTRPGHTSFDFARPYDLKFPCPRGIDVRLSEIVWVADAPNGS
jgi:hypothetical protein